jgi:hypothetical protein
MTALLDAVGRGISETGERLRKMKKKDRPGLVVFVIVTDGHENSSQEYTRDKIREMIKHQREKYNWQFIFLGADDSAFDEARSWGIALQSTAVYNPQYIYGTYSTAATGLSNLRSVYVNWDSSEDCAETFCFTDDDRKTMTSGDSH